MSRLWIYLHECIHLGERSCMSKQRRNTISGNQMASKRIKGEEGLIFRTAATTIH